MGTQYLVYQLYPKKQWMLNSLETREQIDGWLDVYKYMKTKYHLGMALGLVGFILAAYGGLFKDTVKPITPSSLDMPPTLFDLLGMPQFVDPFAGLMDDFINEPVISRPYNGLYR